MINGIIVDDEEIAIEELKPLLGKTSYIHLKNTFDDVSEAIKYVSNNEVDVIFLDIQMPGINGFDAYKAFKDIDKNIDIIFTTAFEEHALKAFEVEAFDYILKPFSEDRILKSIEKLKNYKALGEKNSTNENLNTNVDKITVWKNDKLILLNVEDIIYCKVKGGEIDIVTKKKVYKSEDTMIEMEEKLSSYSFIRCHRNFIVNLKYISEIIPWFNGTYILKFADISDEVPVSRKYNKVLKGIFKF